MKKIIYIVRMKVFLFSLLILWIGVPAKAQNSHWTPNVNPYDDYMIIIAYVTMDELELESNQWEVGCFIGEECRGAIQLTETNYMEHSHLAFLSVWGSSSDNGKPITFRLYGHKNNKEYVIDQSILYEHEGVIGGDDEGPYHFSVIINDAVAVAKAVIENTLFTITDKEGNTEAEVKTWLVSQINRLLTEIGISVSMDDITISNFTAAIATTENNPNGTNGSFVFVVSLTKDGQSDSTDAIYGIIEVIPDNQNGLADITSGKLRAVTTFNGIRISGLVSGEVIKLYNVQGQQLFEKVANSNELLITLHKHGVYIIINARRQIKAIY